MTINEFNIGDRVYTVTAGSEWVLGVGVREFEIIGISAGHWHGLIGYFVRDHGHELGPPIPSELLFMDIRDAMENLHEKLTVIDFNGEIRPIPLKYFIRPK